MGENILKPSKIEFVLGLFPTNSKLGKEKERKGKEMERKGKERKRKVTFTLDLAGGLLVFFDDELKTFRNKIYRLICNVEKIN